MVIAQQQVMAGAVGYLQGFEVAGAGAFEQGTEMDQGVFEFDASADAEQGRMAVFAAAECGGAVVLRWGGSGMAFVIVSLLDSMEPPQFATKRMVTAVRRLVGRESRKPARTSAPYAQPP